MAKAENLNKLMRKIVYALYSDEVHSFYRESSANPQIRYSPTDLFADIQDSNGLPEAVNHLIHLGFLKGEKLQDGRTVYSLSGEKMEQVRDFWFSELRNIMSEKLQVVIAKLFAKKIALGWDESEAQEAATPSFKE
ncbi:MAG: hypothetical protein ACFFBS_04660 [Promethearchaeota archaeon]